MLADLVTLNGVDESTDLFRQFNDRSTYRYHFAHRSQYSNGDIKSELIDTDIDLGR